MVELWSSKPLAWVRFLLLLKIIQQNQHTTVRQKRYNRYKGRKVSLMRGSNSEFFTKNFVKGLTNFYPFLPPRGIKVNWLNYKLAYKKNWFFFKKARVLHPFEITNTLFINNTYEFNLKRVYQFSKFQLLASVIPAIFYTSDYITTLSIEYLTSLPKRPTLLTFITGIGMKWKANMLSKAISSYNSPFQQKVPFRKPTVPVFSLKNNHTLSNRNNRFWNNLACLQPSTVLYIKRLRDSGLKHKCSSRPKRFFFSVKKALWRSLQKSLVQTKFLRFYNYYLRSENFYNTNQIIVNYKTTNEDNWFTAEFEKKPLNKHFSTPHLVTLVGKGQLTRPYLITQGQGLKETFSRQDLLLNNSQYVLKGRPQLNQKFNPSATPQLLLNSLVSNIYFSQTSLGVNVFYKYANFLFTFKGELMGTTNLRSSKALNTFYRTYFFESRAGELSRTNLLPSETFSYKIKVKLVNLFLKKPFNINVTMWYHTMLIRFIEHCSGLKVALAFNPFLENSLTYSDMARCSSWTDRVFDFRRLLGPKIFIKESLKVFHLAFRLKDPTFLSAWIREMLKRTSFWKYRVLFRYIKYLVRHLFFTIFDDLQFKGFKLKLKGKISVGGNSRARTLMYRIGETSQSTFENKVTHDLNFVYTFTGVMGFQLWFYF